MPGWTYILISRQFVCAQKIYCTIPIVSQQVLLAIPRGLQFHLGGRRWQIIDISHLSYHELYVGWHPGLNPSGQEQVVGVSG